MKILLIDDDPVELKKLQQGIAAPHRSLTLLQAKDVATAVAAFRNHDIVVVDRDLTGKPGWEGLEITAEIKRMHPQTIIIINSAFPPNLRGKSELEADYVHVKGLGATSGRGSKSLTEVKKPCKDYTNLNELITKIEQEKLKLTP